ncbi:hypothetical protein [Mycobacterium sp.]|uniref:hypothetical protein n=1 Tax=Mycobacterium sp. TaxID=1785 RepID=UPI0031CFF04B
MASRARTHLREGHDVLGGGITSITSPRRDTTGRIIRDDHYRVHPRIPGSASSTSSLGSKTDT